MCPLFQMQASSVGEALVQELCALLPSQRWGAENFHSEKELALLSWLGETLPFLSGYWPL